jgi:hypothetical protein
MRAFVPVFGIVFLLLAPALRGADLQAWNTTEFAALKTERWTWEMFGVMRVRDHVTDAYDDRVGTLLRVATTPRLGLGVGYLRRYVNFDRLGMHPENRFFAGPTVQVALRPVRVEWVSLYERHFAIRGVRDFNRYKQRVELERMRRGVSPFVYEEMTFKREGFVRTRALAGVRWRWPSGTRFEVGYQFESLLVGTGWMPRHSIRSTLNLGVLFDRRRREP